MKSFFNKILDVFCGINQSDKHQRRIFFGSIILYLLFGILFGCISSVIFTVIFGFIYELTYCYVPYKNKEILGLSVSLPDYSVIKQLDIFNVKRYHAFAVENVYFSICGIIIGMLVKLILVVL